MEEAEKPPQKKRSARRKRESTDDADPNARSRFADLLAASEEAVRDNVDEDSSAESVVTCPACNQVHNHTEQHEHASDSSVSSESEMASNSLLSGHALDPRTQDYFQSLRKDSEIEPEAYDLLFRKCVERESLDKALALYEDLRNHSLTPTFDSLDAMLDLCHQTERWDVGLAVLHDVKARGITLNENIYSKVMSVCSKMEEWDVVIALFDEMKAAQLEQDSDAFSFALHALKEQGDSDRALAEFARVKQLFSQPTQDQYDNVIGVLLQSKRIKEARALMQESNEIDARREQAELEDFGEPDDDDESGSEFVTYKQACQEIGVDPQDTDSDSEEASGGEKHGEAQPEIMYPDSDASEEVEGDEDEDYEDYEDEDDEVVVEESE